MNKSDDFRLDINALRAVAVLVVTLYHFDVPGFSGGFIGVDIFFVISGYLMCRIVVDASDRGRLSVVGFYWARAKRIVPALLALCVCLVVLGYALLLPSDYRLLGKHAISSLAFVSNWVYRTESGYFDVGSHDKWLLHTWSLSVEWQFYLLFPLIMVAALRWLPRRHRLAAFVVSALVSYLWCIWITREDPTSAFYLLPSRAWEMLAGGIVLLLSRLQLQALQRCAVQLTWAGVALIAVSLAVVDSQHAWPGYLAALPVAGAMSVILGHARQGWFGHAAIQAIGRWSYSIYLWHWPLVVAASYLHLGTRPEVKAFGVAMSIALGALSFRWIEAPSSRALARVTLRRGSVRLLYGWGLATAAAVAVYLGDGAPARGIPESALLADREKVRRPRHALNPAECKAATDGLLHPCRYGDGPVGAVVLGDSHSGALISAVTQALSSRHASVVHWEFHACPTVLGVHHHNARFKACPQFIDNALAALSIDLAGVPLVVINRWPTYVNGPSQHEQDAGKRFISFGTQESDSDFRSRFADALVNAMCKVTRTGRKVFVVQPIPEMPFDVPSHMARAAMLTGRVDDVSLSVSDYHHRNRGVLEMLMRAKQECGVVLLDPTIQLCADGRCAGSIDGRPLYIDDDHLGDLGNLLLVPMFRQAFSE